MVKNEFCGKPCASAMLGGLGNSVIGNTLADCSTRQGATKGFEQKGTEETELGCLCGLVFRNPMRRHSVAAIG